MLIEQLRKYYSDLLLLEYQKTKAIAHIKLLVDLLMPINSKTGNLLIKDISDCFNIDSAVGVQLDTVGKYIGLNRFFVQVSIDEGDYFQPTTYLTLNEITEQELGFSTYDTFETSLGGFIQYEDAQQTNNELSDDDYRNLLRMQILFNNSNGSRKQTAENLFKFFGDGIQVADGGAVMSIIYFATPEYTDILNYSLQNGLIPRPAGVRIAASQGTNTYFDFTTYDATSYSDNIGFSDYSNFDSVDGDMFTYDNFEDV